MFSLHAGRFVWRSGPAPGQGRLGPLAPEQNRTSTAACFTANGALSERAAGAGGLVAAPNSAAALNAAGMDIRPGGGSLDMGSGAQVQQQQRGSGSRAYDSGWTGRSCSTDGEMDPYDEEYWSGGSGKRSGGNRDVPMSSRQPGTGKAAAAAGLAAMASTSYIATPGYEEVSWGAAGVRPDDGLCDVRCKNVGCAEHVS